MCELWLGWNVETVWKRWMAGGGKIKIRLFDQQPPILRSTSTLSIAGTRWQRIAPQLKIFAQMIKQAQVKHHPHHCRRHRRQRRRHRHFRYHCCHNHHHRHHHHERISSSKFVWRGKYSWWLQRVWAGELMSCSVECESRKCPQMSSFGADRSHP